jgi:uncharacterized membrane protein YheB (UPF0754 family)
MNLWLCIIPIISAFIGWITNWVAIKMLFRPKQPKKILGITFHGIFPKRQMQFAQHLGKLVSKELLSYTDIEEKITHPDNLKKIMPIVDEHIENFLKNKLSTSLPMLSMFIGDKTIQQLKETFMGTLQQELDLEKIVVEKVSNFSSEKLEEILLQIMSKEFKFVEIIGAVLGFLIGLLQVLLTLLQN